MTGQVDEVFRGPLSGMIGPRARVCERVERRVQSDQLDDLVAGLVAEFLEGDLPDRPVAEIAQAHADDGPSRVKLKIRPTTLRTSLRSMGAVLPCGGECESRGDSSPSPCGGQ